MDSPLATDLYQLTMAQAGLRAGKWQDRGVFHLFFRRLPFEGGYAIAAGLDTVLTSLENFRFSAEDLGYLASLTGTDAQPLFDKPFLEALRSLHLDSLDVELSAVPEGSVMFANEPLLRVTGRLWQAQLLETVLLNTVNYQTLVATKAARVVQAARGRPVLELGMRRARGDAALMGSRAAFIGGCSATSNVLAGQRFGIPVRGTHAHSWVMAFDSELEAFEAYAEAQPNNCVLLVDTFNTLQGVRNAIIVSRQLAQRGHKLLGIRLDSGDLAWLSIEARKLLDAAGLHDTQIIASNDLDEHLIESLIQQGARIDAWGVGTKLVTAYDEPALTGVYKLSMIQSPSTGGKLVPRIKLSEQAAKISNPGVQQVRRFSRAGQWVADAIYDEQLGCASPCVLIDPFDPARERSLGSELTHEDLLVPVWRAGQRVAPAPPLAAVRERAQRELQKLDPTVKRLVHPHQYPVGLSAELYAERMRLVRAARERSARPGTEPLPS